MSEPILDEDKVPNPSSRLGNIKVITDDVRATNWKFGKKVFESDNYTFKILDITIKDDVPAYTVAQYIINGDKRTNWISYNKDALYYIRKGRAWFMIGEEGKTLEAGYYVCVPKNTRHTILNNYNESILLVDLIFPGQIRLD